MRAFSLRYRNQSVSHKGTHKYQLHFQFNTTYRISQAKTHIYCVRGVGAKNKIAEHAENWQLLVYL